MEDFSRLHDAVTATVTPLTNFSDEATSSALFVVLVLLAVGLGAAGHLVPWRMVLLLGGWVVTGLGHPVVKRWVTGLVVSVMTMTATPKSSSTTTSTTTPNKNKNKEATHPPSSPQPPSILSLTKDLQNRAYILVSRFIADDIILFDASHTKHNSNNDKYIITVTDTDEDYTNHNERENCANGNEDSNSSILRPREKYQVEIFEFQQQQQQQQQPGSNSQQSVFSPSPDPPCARDASYTRLPLHIDAVLPPLGSYRWVDDEDDDDDDDEYNNKGWKLDLEGVHGDGDGDGDDDGDGDEYKRGWTTIVVPVPLSADDEGVGNDDDDDDDDDEKNDYPKSIKWRRRRWTRMVERVGG